MNPEIADFVTRYASIDISDLSGACAAFAQRTGQTEQLNPLRRLLGAA